MFKKAGMVSFVKDITKTMEKSLILISLLSFLNLFLTLALIFRKVDLHFRKFELAKLSKNIRILMIEFRKFPVYLKSVFPHVYT